MRCIADVHYKVIRRESGRCKWWLPTEERKFTGEIVSLDCAYCDFRVLKRHIGKPKSSKSGLGRYNRMRGQMVAHLHEHHREELSKPTPREALLGERLRRLRRQQ